MHVCTHFLNTVWRNSQGSKPVGQNSVEARASQEADCVLWVNPCMRNEENLSKLIPLCVDNQSASDFHFSKLN